MEENKLRNEAEEQVEITVERKLVELYTLQQIDSKIDKIRIIRGELPLEVQDLEDEIAGMETRIAKYNEELEKFVKDIAAYKNKIKESTALIKKYEEQQNNVRNNREYESLTKEIEYQLDRQGAVGAAPGEKFFFVGEQGSHSSAKTF